LKNRQQTYMYDNGVWNQDRDGIVSGDHYDWTWLWRKQRAPSGYSKQALEPDSPCFIYTH